MSDLAKRLRHRGNEDDALEVEQLRQVAKELAEALDAFVSHGTCFTSSELDAGRDALTRYKSLIGE